jgi:hypothetical protein
MAGNIEQRLQALEQKAINSEQIQDLDLLVGLNGDEYLVIKSPSFPKLAKISASNFQETTGVATTIKITTSANFNASALINGLGQNGRRVIIDNGASNIEVNVDATLDTTYMKKGSGTVTFTEGAGRTLVACNTVVLLQNEFDVAYIGSVGTQDRLYINVI